MDNQEQVQEQVQEVQVQEPAHLLTVEEFRQLARPTSKHVDVEEVRAFIREVEDMTIIPAFGLDVFERLTGEELDDNEKILLDGGTWVQSVVDRCDGQNGLRRKCSGLKTALAYFVYGKMLQSDGGIVTRTGVMRHDDEYASHVDDKNRVRRYNDVMNVAESYLSGCLQFWKNVKGCGSVGQVRASRVHVHAIGD